MIRSIIRHLGTDMLHLLAPELCPGCDEQLEETEGAWCAACRASTAPAPLPAELLASLTARFGVDALAIDAVASLMRYDPASAARRALHAVKYEGCTRLGSELGRQLAAYLRVVGDPFTSAEVVVPVPIHRARRRERGYNQAEAIALGLVDGAIGSRVLTALARTRHTRSQTTLNADRRLANVEGIFAAAGETLRGQRVLICDDVLTTGATVNACASVLRDMGASMVMAATVARDEVESVDDPSSLFSIELV